MGQVLNSKRFALICILLIVFLIYGNTVKNEYTYDGKAFVAQNEYVKKGVAGIPDLFTQASISGKKVFKEHGLGFRPIPYSTFALEYALWGENPHISHFIQMLFYAFACLMIYLTLGLLFQNSNYQSRWVVLFITLLFAVHPIHTEVLNDLKNRDELFAFLGVVSSLYFLIRSVKAKDRRLLLVSVAAYLFGLLSKTNAITALAIVPLSLYFFTACTGKKIIKYALLFVLVSIPVIGYHFYLIGVLAFHDGIVINTSVTATPTILFNSLAGAEGPLQRFASAIHILGVHIKKLVFPHPLVHQYRYNVIPLTNFSNIWVWITLFIYLVIIVLSIKGAIKKKVWAYGGLFFLITDSIYSNLVVLQADNFAERYLFMPSLGFAIVLGVILIKLFNIDPSKPFIIKKNRFFVGVFIGLMLLASLKVIARNQQWRDNFTLFTHDIKYIPNCVRANLSLGQLYAMKAKKQRGVKRRSFYKKAEQYYQKALKIYPESGVAWDQLGVLYRDQSQVKRSIRSFKKALQNIDPYYQHYPAEIYNNLSVAYGKTRRYKSAIKAVKKALEIDSNNITYINNLAIHYYRMGKLDSAILISHRSLSIDSSYFNTNKNLHIFYKATGNEQKARYFKQKALQFR